MTSNNLSLKDIFKEKDSDSLHPDCEESQCSVAVGSKSTIRWSTIDFSDRKPEFAESKGQGVKL